MRHTLSGKISRLPHHLREEIHSRLRDGQPASTSSSSAPSVTMWPDCAVATTSPSASASNASASHSTHLSTPPLPPMIPITPISPLSPRLRGERREGSPCSSKFCHEEFCPAPRQGRSKVWKRRSGFRQKAAEIPRSRWFGRDFRTALAPGWRGGNNFDPARR